MSARLSRLEPSSRPINVVASGCCWAAASSEDDMVAGEMKADCSCQERYKQAVSGPYHTFHDQPDQTKLNAVKTKLFLYTATLLMTS